MSEYTDIPLKRIPKRHLFLTGSCILVGLGLCLITVLITTTFISKVIQLAVKMPPQDQSPEGQVASVLDRFMQAMAEKNPRLAFEILDGQAQQKMTLKALTDSLNSGDFRLYEGYERMVIFTTQIDRVNSYDGGEASKDIANTTGKIFYAEGTRSVFHAILEKMIGSEWKLSSLEISIPPTLRDGFQKGVELNHQEQD